MAATGDDGGAEEQSKTPSKRRRTSKGGNGVLKEAAASPSPAAVEEAPSTPKAKPASAEEMPAGAELMNEKGLATYGYIQVSATGACEDDDGAWFSDPEADLGPTNNAAPLDTACSDAVDWKRGLQELRRNAAKRRQAKDALAGGSSSSQQQRRRPTAEELVSLVRSAVESGDWAAIVSPGAGQLPQPPVVGAAVRQLSDTERIAVLGASAARYEEEPFDRNASGTWVMQVLEQGGAFLAGRSDLREALRPLLSSVSKSLGSNRRHGDVLACLGSWRLVAELAAAQREATKAKTSAVEEASKLLHKSPKKQRS